MAEIVQDPQLRYTPDNLAVAELLVQFPAIKAEDPPETLKVVGWGNLAQTIQDEYHVGDRVILEGRLGMNTVDRPEGFKEKRAELTIQKIHRLGAGTDFNSYATTTTPRTAAPAAPAAPSAAPPVQTAPPAAVTPPIPTAAPDYDDIPF